MERVGNHLPSDFIKKQIFVPGGAFIKIHQFINEPPQKRRFFVLNKNPESDNKIITVHASTQIEKRKKHRQPEVLVEIKPEEYPELTEHSIIDCESYIVWYKPVLESQIKKGKIKPLQQLPTLKLKELRNAIGRSKTLAPIDKRLVVGEEEIMDSTSSSSSEN